MSSNSDVPKDGGPTARADDRAGVSLQVTILALFLLIVVPLALAIIAANYVLNQRASLVAAKVLLEEVDRTVTGEIARLFEPVIAMAGNVAVVPGVTQSPDAGGHPAVPMLLRSVEDNRFQGLRHDDNTRQSPVYRHRQLISQFDGCGANDNILSR